MFHCLVIKVVCLATACSLYHISFSLSSTFFKFFQSFSNSSGFPNCSSDLWLSALFKRLDYFNTKVLSCQALFKISFFFQKSIWIVLIWETIISDSSTNITLLSPTVNPFFYFFYFLSFPVTILLSTDKKHTMAPPYQPPLYKTSIHKNISLIM